MVDQNYSGIIPKEINAFATIRAHSDSIDYLKLYEKGNVPLLVSAGHDKTLKTWDLNRKTHVLSLIGHTEAVFCCDVSNKGQVVSCSPDQTVRTWDLRTGQEVSRGLGHTYKIYSVIYTSDTSVVSCGRDRKILL